MTQSDTHSAMQDPAVKRQVTRLRRRSLRDAIIGWIGATFVIGLLVVGTRSAIAPLSYNNDSLSFGFGVGNWVAWVAWSSTGIPGALRWQMRMDNAEIDANYDERLLTCTFDPPSYAHFHKSMGPQWPGFLAAPVWSLVLVVILVTLYLLRGAIRRRRWRVRGLCIACGYDLTGNPSSICPECAMPKAL